MSLDFKSDEICKEIALTVTPLVDSPHLKFQSSKGEQRQRNTF